MAQPKNGWLGIDTITGDPELDMHLANQASPEQVAQGARMLGLPLPKKIDRASISQSQKNAVTDTDSTTKLQNQINKQGNRQEQKDITIDTDNDSTGRKNDLFNTGAVDPVLKYLRMQPEYQDLQGGIGDLEAGLSMAKGMRTVDSPWVKPLIALTDSMTGSKLMEGYTEPPSSTDQIKEIFKYRDALARRKNDAAKSLMGGVNKFRTGSEFEKLFAGNKNISGLTGTTTNDVSNLNQTSTTKGQKTTNEQGVQQMVGEGFKGGGKKGTYRIPAKLAQDLGEALNLPNRIDELLTDIKAHPKQLGPTSAAKNWALNLVGMENEAAPLDSRIQSLRQDIGKMKEGGVLRYEDELKYNKMLTNLRNNPKTADVSLKLMKRELVQKVQSHISGLNDAGYDVEQFKPKGAALEAPPTFTEMERRKKSGPAGFKAGQRMQKGGSWYVRDAQGTWHPEGN